MDIDAEKVEEGCHLLDWPERAIADGRDLRWIQWEVMRGGEEGKGWVDVLMVLLLSKSELHEFHVYETPGKTQYLGMI